MIKCENVLAMCAGYIHCSVETQILLPAWYSALYWFMDERKHCKLIFYPNGCSDQNQDSWIKVFRTNCLREFLWEEYETKRKYDGIDVLR